MLYMPKTSLFDSAEASLSANAAVTAEGQAMVAAADGVKESAGTAGEVFAGFVCNRVSAAPIVEGFATRVEVVTVATAGCVQVDRDPIGAGSIGIVVAATGVSLGGTTTVSAKLINNSLLTVGMTVVITYRYALSVVEARSMQGDVQPGGWTGSIVGQCGLVSRGIIYTNMFDCKVNWAKVSGIKLAANGMVTDENGSGTAIDAYVVDIPTSMCPFLGLKFSAI